MDLTGEDFPTASFLPSFTNYNIRTAQAFGTILKTRTEAKTANVLARSWGHTEYWADKPEGEIFVAINQFGKGQAAYISYNTLPPKGPYGLIYTDMVFYWHFSQSYYGESLLVRLLGLFKPLLVSPMSSFGSTTQAVMMDMPGSTAIPITIRIVLLKIRRTRRLLPLRPVRFPRQSVRIGFERGSKPVM